MSIFLEAALIYLAAVNIAGFILPLSDKRRAKAGKWRIPEKTLFAVSLLGGSAAMYISMRIFHHKTLHKRFMIGIPLIMIAQAALVLGIFLVRTGRLVLPV